MVYMATTNNIKTIIETIESIMSSLLYVLKWSMIGFIKSMKSTL